MKPVTMKGYLSILSPTDVAFIAAVPGRLPRARTIVGVKVDSLTVANAPSVAVLRAAKDRAPGLYKASMHRAGPLSVEGVVAKRPIDLAGEIARLEDQARITAGIRKGTRSVKEADKLRIEGITCRALADALRERMKPPYLTSVENHRASPARTHLAHLRFWGLTNNNPVENPRVGFTDYEDALEWLGKMFAQEAPTILDRQDGVLVSRATADTLSVSGRYDG